MLFFTLFYNENRKESKILYYERICQNKKACVVKVIDRCNNVSTMAGCFSREGIVNYIQETEEQIIPLINHIKNYPEYNDLAFLVKYQIISLIESIKSML